MKIGMLLLGTLLSQLSYSQQVEHMAYCGCTDEVDVLSPALEGTFTRRCNDNLVETGAFKGGQKTGEWITFSSKGKIIRQFNYRDGKLDGAVHLFYSNGKAKFTGAFTKGLPDSSWTYYTHNGKTWISGTYKSGAPIGVWTIFDDKGKSKVVEYDYTNNKAIKNGDPSFLKNKAIVKNDNTLEYFVLYYPTRVAANNPSPLGGYYFASDMLVQLMEVPINYWDTYESYHYKLTVDLSASHIASYKVSVINDHMPDGTPILPFIVNTDPANQIKKAPHSKLSKKLLDYKVAEAISLLPPWINSSATSVQVYVPYVVNQIIFN